MARKFKQTEKKSTRSEIEHRVDVIYEMLVRRYKRRDILLYASKNWGVTSRQLDTYTARARARLEEEAAEHRKNALVDGLALRRELINQGFKDKNYHLVLETARDEAKLLGLYADRLGIDLDTGSTPTINIVHTSKE